MRAPSIAADAWKRHPFITRISRYIDLDDADLEALRRLLEAELSAKKRKDLVVDGYEYRKLCFIEDGFAARYKLLRNGKRQIVNVVMPGDVVGLPGSFLERAGYSVIALTDLNFHVCSIEAYVDLCYHRPQFGLVMAWLAVHEAVICGEHIIDAGRRTPIERLAHFLLELHARLAAVGRAGKASFELAFSQEVLGDALGLSVPHLNRMLGRLRADGLITLEDHQVKFTDPEALQMLGHFQPFRLVRISDLARAPRSAKVS
jgi:CRP-like cAMP-binding protein